MDLAVEEIEVAHLDRTWSGRRRGDRAVRRLASILRAVERSFIVCCLSGASTRGRGC